MAQNTVSIPAPAVVASKVQEARNIIALVQQKFVAAGWDVGAVNAEIVAMEGLRGPAEPGSAREALLAHGVTTKVIRDSGLFTRNEAAHASPIAAPVASPVPAAPVASPVASKPAGVTLPIGKVAAPRAARESAPRYVPTAAAVADPNVECTERGMQILGYDSESRLVCTVQTSANGTRYFACRKLLAKRREFQTRMADGSTVASGSWFGPVLGARTITGKGSISTKIKLGEESKGAAIVRALLNKHAV